MIGMSSGGFQTGIALNIKEVDFYFPLITGAPLGSITWKGKLTKNLKKNINKKGLDESDLNKVWAILDQVHMGHHCKARHIKQFISLYDQVVPLKFQQILWEIYDKPEKYEMLGKEDFELETSLYAKLQDEVQSYLRTKLL